MTRFFEASTTAKVAVLGLGSLLVVYTSSLLFGGKKLRSRKQQSKPKDGPSSQLKNVDSILYRTSSCDDKYDIIVIGSGIGGLTTSSLLAQKGFKVLVLEQHV